MYSIDTRQSDNLLGNREPLNAKRDPTGGETEQAQSGGAALAPPARDLDVVIGDLFWHVNGQTGVISDPQPLTERNTQNSSYEMGANVQASHNLKMLFTREKGTRLYVDKEGLLQKSWWRSAKKVGKAVNEVLEPVLQQADQLEGADERLAPLSHFLYHFMNREGSIGRLSQAVGYTGDRAERLFNKDLLHPHVDIVIGEQYWSVNTVTDHISKALPLAERHSRVKAINLNADADADVNANLGKLFERTPKAFFRVDDEGLLQQVKGLRGRVKYWWNRTAERAKVQEAVSRAIGHLDSTVGKVNNAALTTFLRKKFQDKGPLATMKKVHYNRKVISECGGLEKHLEHGLDEAWEVFIEKYNRWEKFPPIKLPEIEVSEADRGRVEKLAFAVFGMPRCIEQLLERTQLNLQTAINYMQMEKDVKEALNADFVSMCTELMWRRIHLGAVNKLHIEDDSQLQDALVSELEKHPVVDDDVLAVLECRTREIIENQAEDALQEYVFQEYLFAQSLGMELELTAGGAGSARYAFDRYGHRTLVVKPGDEGPYGKNNLSWSARIKKFILGERKCLGGNFEHINEYISFLASRIFKFKIVPTTSIRSITSTTFVGEESKWCSVQTYVDGYEAVESCLGLSEGWNKWYWKLYRDIIPFFTGKRTAMEESFKGEGRFAQNLIAFLGGQEDALSRAFTRLAIHNVLIQDTDSHLANVLYKKKQIEEDDEGIQDLSAERAENRNLSRKEFFQGKHFYKLQDAFLHDEDGCTLAKIDSGASMPHCLPESNFDMRLAYVFDVLPFMQKSMPEAIKSMFKNADRSYYEWITEAMKLNLEHVSDPEDYAAISQKPRPYELCQRWLFTESSREEERMRTHLATVLSKVHTEESTEWHQHYDRHLARIKGMADTSMDRWEAITAHMLEKTKELPVVQIKEALAVRDKSPKALCDLKKPDDFKKFRHGHGTNSNYTQQTKIRTDSIGGWIQQELKQRTTSRVT